MQPIEAWTVGRLLAGLDAGTAMDAMSEPIRRLVEKATSLEVDQREPFVTGYLFARPDADKSLELIASIDPNGEPPPTAPPVRPATLADIRSQRSDEPYLWEGYIPSARIGGIGAFEGVGKTRFAMDLARRIWFRLPWPDGQSPTLPPETPTLWICSDGQQDELLTIAEAYGMPDGAVFFNTPADEPYGGTEIDSVEDLERLERFILEVKPGLVFIDTVTNATNYDLNRATENKAFTTPIRDIAQRTKTTIVPLVHLSREGQALGRRIRGVIRSLIQLECPNPAEPGRLRLWIEKTNEKRPAELGVTMGDKGNEYDTNPPRAVEAKRTGRPSEARDKAVAFIVESLTRSNDQPYQDLKREFENSGGCKKTFGRAMDDLEQEGRLIKDGGTGKGKKMVLHLVMDDEASPSDDTEETEVPTP